MLPHRLEPHGAVGAVAQADLVAIAIVIPRPRGPARVAQRGEAHDFAPRCEPEAREDRVTRLDVGPVDAEVPDRGRLPDVGIALAADLGMAQVELCVGHRQALVIVVRGLPLRQLGIERLDQVGAVGG